MNGNWKGFGTTQLWHNHGTNLAFVWGNKTNHKKTWSGQPVSQLSYKVGELPIQGYSISTTSPSFT